MNDFDDVLFGYVYKFLTKADAEDILAQLGVSYDRITVLLSNAYLDRHFRDTRRRPIDLGVLGKLYRANVIDLAELTDELKRLGYENTWHKALVDGLSRGIL